jgi:hypothetical protein
MCSHCARVHTQRVHSGGLTENHIVTALFRLIRMSKRSCSAEQSRAEQSTRSKATLTKQSTRQSVSAPSQSVSAPSQSVSQSVSQPVSALNKVTRCALSSHSYRSCWRWWSRCQSWSCRSHTTHTVNQTKPHTCPRRTPRSPCGLHCWSCPLHTRDTPDPRLRNSGLRCCIAGTPVSLWFRARWRGS